jgi:imidazolonepropionase-like amidohydrolase
MLSVAEVQAIVAEAHKLHRIVTAHVLEGPGLAIALALQVMQAATAKAGVELGMSPLGILRQTLRPTSGRCEATQLSPCTCSGSRSM